MSLEKQLSFEKIKPYIEIEPSFEGFVPKEFINNPIEYFEKQGKNIKKGDIKKDDEGRIREDPTAVKELPVWTNKEGLVLSVVGKKINIEKGQVGKQGDPFWEYQVMKYVRSLGLPAAQPILKASIGNTHLIIMERVSGINYYDKEVLSESFKNHKYTKDDVKMLQDSAEQAMREIEQAFLKAGIKRGFKLKDMVFEIDFENRKVLKVIPVDWERTKIR